MRSAIAAALVTSLTFGGAVSAAVTAAPTSSAGPVRRESAEWRRAREAVFGGAADGAAAQVASAAATPFADPALCPLQAPGSDAVPSGGCLACHTRRATHAHPVGVDYAAAESLSRGSLRPLAAVVARGVFLPNGAVECTTCHDARSPWAAHVALPPGAVASPAVDPRRRETYENPRSWRTARPLDPSQQPPGSAVTAAPLCAACHTLAD